MRFVFCFILVNGYKTIAHKCIARKTKAIKTAKEILQRKDIGIDEYVTQASAK